MRILVSLFFCSFVLFSCTNTTELPASMTCDNAIEASLINYSDLDACEWAFQSDAVDLLIEPLNLEDFVTDPQEGKSLMITYIERPDLATVCQIGVIVELTCVE